ncbi:hypothetical protein C6Q14_14705 [Burkholderia ambifaria]|nr:hypothetical protein C6Q14_14705 [Burkholderia ambifaria]
MAFADGRADEPAGRVTVRGGRLRSERPPRAACRAQKNATERGFRGVFHDAARDARATRARTYFVFAFAAATAVMLMIRRTVAAGVRM